jgi:copper chaperone
MAQPTSYTFTVAGMHCASCGLLIDDVVEDFDGVTTSATSMRTGRATVILDPAVCSPDQVIAAIGGAGPYTAKWEQR